jgi:hypothetical protein
MDNEKNKTENIKAQEVAGYLDYLNRLMFLEECDLELEI